METGWAFKSFGVSQIDYDPNYVREEREGTVEPVLLLREVELREESEHLSAHTQHMKEWMGMDSEAGQETTKNKMDALS